MYRKGGGVPRPALKKVLENRYRVEMRVQSPIFQGKFIEKKKIDNFISLDAREG